MMRDMHGTQKQRTLGVVAIAYCEIASLSPQQIAPTSSIYSRLSAYAEMRQEVSDNTSHRSV